MRSLNTCFNVIFRAACSLCLCEIVTQDGCLHAAEGVEQDRENPRSLRLKDWEDVSIEVLSTRTNHLLQVRGKESRYSGLSVLRDSNGAPKLHTNMSVSITVTAFVTGSGKMWAGPKRDFYIETDSGIVGGSGWGACVYWCESMVGNRADEKLDTDAVVRIFDSEARAIGLYDAMNPVGGFMEKKYDPTGFQKLLKASKQVTNLWPFLEEVFDSMLGGYKIRGRAITGNAVQLDFTNENRQATAFVWIDIKSKEVVRAVENGKQVFPK